jgi:hypothetical protein
MSPKIDDFSTYHKIRDTLKEASLQIKEEEAKDICEAYPINQKEYTSLLESKRAKDKDETYSMKRYLLTSSFDLPHDKELNLDWVKHNINYYSGYKNFKLFKNDITIDESINKCKRLIKEFSKNNKEKRFLSYKSPSLSSSDDDRDDRDEKSPYKKKTIKEKIHNQIHYDKTFYKIYHCLNFVKEAGFKTLNDTDKIKVDYSNLHRYCRENEENIRAVFERSKFMVWSDNDDKLDPNEKKSLSKYVNQKLESCFGIRLSKATKGGTYNNYEINHFSL